MSTNARIGKKYTSNRPSNIILPRSKSLSVQTIKTWKDAITYAQLEDHANRLPLLQIYDSILIDSHLQSIIESRVLRVLGSKFKFVNAKGEENKELNGLFETKWFLQFLTHAMWSRFLGTTVLELWDLNEDQELCNTTLIPRENCLFSDGIIVKEVGDERGYQYKEGVYTNNYIQIGEDNDLGILANAAPDPLTKKFAKAAWAEYVEKFGIPPRVVTTDSHNDKRHQELADMLANMVSSHWAVLQGGEKLEMMNTQGVDAHSTFDNLITRMNSEMSKRILGQDGTTDSKDTKGTYGSLQILEGVAEDRHESDRVFIKYLINDELLWRLELISPKYAALKDHRFDWDDTKELNSTELMTLVKDISASGFVVDPDYITEKTTIPIIGRSNLGATGTDEETSEKKKPKLNAEAKSSIVKLYANLHNNSSFVSLNDGLQKQFVSWARDIYYNDNAAQTNWTIINETAAVLIEAIAPKAKVKASTGVEGAFYNNLQTNLFVFSAAKTFTQYAEISELLTDEDGKQRPFTAFKNDVLKLHEKYNVNYLKTEYNQALRTAQAASKWKRFESQKDLFDLQYDTAGDDKVRDDHSKLHGITRPVDDGFWNKYYPPIDWACRCTVRQVAKGNTLTPDIELKALPKVPKAFQFNAGKQQLVFSNNHPYIQTLAKNSPRELQAVKDYGLKEARTIYAKGKNLSTPLKPLDSVEKANEWFNNIAVNKKATLTAKVANANVKVTLHKTEFDAIIKNNKNSFKWINNLPKMLNNAHEIYVLNAESKTKTYRFITFFKDSIKIVNSDHNYKITDSYNSSINNASKERQGVLIYKK